MIGVENIFVKDFDNLCKENGIRHLNTMSYMPQQMELQKEEIGHRWI